MSNEKIYVGNGKVMTGNFGQFHKLSFSAKDIQTLQNNLNEKGYVNIVLNERQTPSQYGATHSMVIDTWQPPAQQQAPQQAPQYNTGQTVNNAPVQGFQPPVTPQQQFNNPQQGQPLPNYNNIQMDTDTPF